MPLLEITSNTTIDDPQDLARQASKLTADILGKPESYVMVKVSADHTLIFGGSNEPAAYIQLKSLGLSENRTAEYSEKLCAFISKTLNINSNRTYIEFSSPERHMWGWDKTTF